ncbi:MAG: hypothetical protein LBQ44_01680 [Treponema sp.]|nr:hypothetical protein [Treponema sp.]
MPKTQPMALHDKLQLIVKSIELEEQGKAEEAKKIGMQVPLAPYLTKFAKEKIGADFLIKSGFNLSDAEAEYGPDWLTR